MSATQIILLERIEHLGNIGDVVSVKPGYARNYLLPGNKALRATEENIAYFETQRKRLEEENEKRKSEAQKHSDKIKDLKVVIIRQASEGGQLYGSVTARDIAEAASEEIGEKIERNMVELNQNFKYIGLFPVSVRLHPEVKVEIIVNIARSEEEAKKQERTGKAMIAGNEEQEAREAKAEKAAAANDEVFEESALEAIEAEKDETAAEATEEAEKEA